MSDTPRTDEAVDYASNFHPDCEVVNVEVAIDLERELAEAREQRNTLAEALEMVATHTYADGQCDNGYSPQYVAKQSLAAVKGGSHDS